MNWCVIWDLWYVTASLVMQLHMKHALNSDYMLVKPSSLSNSCCPTCLQCQTAMLLLNDVSVFLNRSILLFVIVWGLILLMLFCKLKLIKKTPANVIDEKEALLKTCKTATRLYNLEHQLQPWCYSWLSYSTERRSQHFRLCLLRPYSYS